jgi:hypothetical protein
VALLVAVAWLVVTAGNPLPPRTLVMTTGPVGSAQAEFGERYREIFRAAGVDLQLRSSAGGLANVGLLRDTRSEVSVGFVESGLAHAVTRPIWPRSARWGWRRCDVLPRLEPHAGRATQGQARLDRRRGQRDAPAGTPAPAGEPGDESSLTLLALPPERAPMP